MTAPRLPNLFKVPELKEKILFTLLCLVVYRIGAHIATPGVNVQALADFLRNQGQGTLFSLYDLFAGGSFGRATVFALGIMPYISASIVFQLAAPVFPIVEKMQRDEEGRKSSRSGPATSPSCCACSRPTATRCSRSRSRAPWGIRGSSSDSRRC